MSQGSSQVHSTKSTLPTAAVLVFVEATAVGLCLGLWLNLNVFTAMTGGLILSALCPALVYTTMQQWQQFKLGTDKGKIVAEAHPLHTFSNKEMARFIGEMQGGHHSEFGFAYQRQYFKRLSIQDVPEEK